MLWGLFKYDSVFFKFIKLQWPTFGLCSKRSNDLRAGLAMNVLHLFSACRSSGTWGFTRWDGYCRTSVHNTAENFSEEVRSGAVLPLCLRGDADIDVDLDAAFVVWVSDLTAGSPIGPVLRLKVSSVCTSDAMVLCESGSFMRSRLCMTPSTASVHPPGVECWQIWFTSITLASVGRWSLTKRVTWEGGVAEVSLQWLILRSRLYDYCDNIS